MPVRLLPSLAAAALLGLAACTETPPPPPPPIVSGGRVATASATPAPAAAAVTRFDGLYGGTVTLNPDRTRRCPDGAPQVEATVRQGRASLVINPSTRQTLSGTVGQDGSVRMVDVVDRTIMTSGIFSAEAFIGQHQNGLCTYAVNLKRIR